MYWKVHLMMSRAQCSTKSGAIPNVDPSSILQPGRPNLDSGISSSAEHFTEASMRFISSARSASREFASDSRFTMALATMGTVNTIELRRTPIHFAVGCDIYVSQLIRVNPLFHPSYSIVQHLHHYRIHQLKAASRSRGPLLGRIAIDGSGTIWRSTW